jgi:hypothetical protein
MKTNRLKYSILTALAFAALALAPSASLGANDIIFGPAGGETSVSNPDGTWINMWGPAFVSTTFDTANPPPTGNTTGSAYVQNNRADNSGQDSYNMISPGTWYRAVVFDGAGYSSIELDIKYDTNSTINPNSAHLEVGMDSGYVFHSVITISFNTNSALSDGNWHHVSVPISASMPAIGSVGGAAFYQWNQNSPGTMNFWMANVKMIARIVPLAPPTMSISKPTAGLNFVQGSVSGQYDRQNIRTVNGATLSYSWVGLATAGNPVTYSFDVSQWNAPDLNYHIFFTPGITGGETASDYNEANVMIFQILQVAGGTQASILWKTNLPSASTANIAVQVTNTSSILGKWQVQFTSDTAGEIIAPDSTPYPFTVDPGLVAGLANPAMITFGVGPTINSPTVVGESVVVSRIGITGAASLSSTVTAYEDVFTNDAALITDYWQVNALFAPSIWLVPTNNPYCINWTIPDSGFSLVIQTNVTSLAAGNSPGLTTVALIPGARTLIPQSDLPPGNQVFFALIKRSFTQLQVLLPGETNAPNTLTGKGGTPTAATSGDLVTVTVNAVDATWNKVNVSGDNIHLTTTDNGVNGAITPTDSALAGGTMTGIVQFNDSGSWTTTATDTTNTNIPPSTSSPITVN